MTDRPDFSRLTWACDKHRAVGLSADGLGCPFCIIEREQMPNPKPRALTISKREEREARRVEARWKKATSEPRALSARERLREIRRILDTAEGRGMGSDVALLRRIYELTTEAKK